MDARSPPDPDREERSQRLRRLLLLEIRRILEDLEAREALLLELWGRERIRAPFLETAFSRYRSLGFPDLMLLGIPEVEALERFARELDDLRFYFAYTQDMPQAVRAVFRGALVRLQEAGRNAMSALGGEGLASSPALLPWGFAEE